MSERSGKRETAILLAIRARELAQCFRQTALRKVKILWELDVRASRRCEELADEAWTLALALDELGDRDDEVGRAELTASLADLQAEAEALGVVTGTWPEPLRTGLPPNKP